MDIIGYIHICQKGEWKRSFEMLIACIKKTKLYKNIKAIRLGILNNDGVLIEDEILNDPLFEIIHIGKSSEYERPTLLHMRKKSESEDVNYFYLHTKGIRHFGSPNEQQIIDWINLMLYWNIEQWKLAIEKLKIYDTYGCNIITGRHYSGNFWWANSTHIRELPTQIESYYTAPEDWVHKKKDIKIYTVYNSGYQGMGHYTKCFPREKYENVQPM